MVNGRLRSVPEELYDGCIRREMEAMGEVFQEARLIGNVLGKYAPGVGDIWTHDRIETMVHAGELEPVDAVPENRKDFYPVYHRKLRRKL